MGVCVLGSINLDIVCQVAELPAPGETVMGLSVSRYPGGKGLNQAIAAARWGAPTAMIGAVGADTAGAELLAVLADAGISTAAIETRAGAATGQAHIFVSGAGENMIVVAGGVNRDLRAPRLDAELAASRVFLAQLEVPAAAIRALFKEVRTLAGDHLTVLNAAPALAEGAELFPLTDILVVNETELARYAGSGAPPGAPDEAVPLARRLISRPGQTVVVTLGAEGATAVTEESAETVPGRPARVVDTTGAGDCFCGVLAAALSEGAPLRQALSWANAAAALSTETAGAAVSMPTRAAVAAR